MLVAFGLADQSTSYTRLSIAAIRNISGAVMVVLPDVTTRPEDTVLPESLIICVWRLIQSPAHGTMREPILV